jgi:drug/metabolite transporter (DMT)-like permease
MWPRKDAAVTYSGLILLSLIWGLAFVAIKEADQVLSPVNLALMRWLIASALFLALLPSMGRSKSRLERKDIPRLLIVGFANVAGYHISLNYAETSIRALDCLRAGLHRSALGLASERKGRSEGDVGTASCYRWNAYSFR